jgi:hypothetical protein
MYTQKRSWEHDNFRPRRDNDHNYYIIIIIDGKRIKIPLPPEVYAYYQMYFRRDKPTNEERGRYITMLKIAIEVYKYAFISREDDRRYPR